NIRKSNADADQGEGKIQVPQDRRQRCENETRSDRCSPKKRWTARTPSISERSTNCTHKMKDAENDREYLRHGSARGFEVLLQIGKERRKAVGRAGKSKSD